MHARAVAPAQLGLYYGRSFCSRDARTRGLVNPSALGEQAQLCHPCTIPKVVGEKAARNRVLVLSLGFSLAVTQ